MAKQTQRKFAYGPMPLGFHQPTSGPSRPKFADSAFAISATRNRKNSPTVRARALLELCGLAALTSELRKQLEARKIFPPSDCGINTVMFRDPFFVTITPFRISKWDRNKQTVSSAVSSDLNGLVSAIDRSLDEQSTGAVKAQLRSIGIELSD